MPKLPVLSGLEIIRILTRDYGFRVIRQRSSHITLTNDRVFVTVPNHREVDRGTLLAILRKAEINPDDFRR